MTIQHLLIAMMTEITNISTRYHEGLDCPIETANHLLSVAHMIEANLPATTCDMASDDFCLTSDITCPCMTNRA